MARQLQRACHDTLPWLISFSLDATAALPHAALRNVPRTTWRVVSGHRVFIHLGGVGHRHSSAASACRGSHRGPLDRRVGLSLVYSARVVVLAYPTLPFRSAVVAIVALAGLHSLRRAVRHLYRCLLLVAAQRQSTCQHCLMVHSRVSDWRRYLLRRFHHAQMFWLVAHTASNQSMKPTAPLRNKFSELATTPCRGLSLSR